QASRGTSYRSGVPRYKMTIAYDGTDFCGWQRQVVRPEGGEQGDGGQPSETAPVTSITHSPPSPPSPPSCSSPLTQLRTAQGVVQAAVREVVREPVYLLGASRTDSGVHARGQVA